MKNLKSLNLKNLKNLKILRAVSLFASLRGFARDGEDPGGAQRGFLGIIFLLVLAISLMVEGGSALCEAAASEISASAIRERGVLRVALEDDHWAYFLRWHEGEPSGLCVDLAAHVADALGVSPVYIPLPWGEGDEGSISGVLAGSPWGPFDLIASTVTMTPERSVRVHFSEPYALVGQMVLLHRGSQRIISLESLQGRRVGFPRDTTSEPAARTLSSLNEMVPLENASATLQAFKEKLVDVVVIDSPLALLFLKAHPEIQVLDKLLTRESYALVLPLSSDSELRSLVNRVVVGQREILQNRWIP